MTDEQILKLAKTCGFNSENAGATYYWECWERQLFLDEMLEEEEQKKIKAQKRKELIARMSDEEKELLGVK